MCREKGFESRGTLRQWTLLRHGASQGGHYRIGPLLSAQPSTGHDRWMYMLAEYASDWIWVIARALTTHEPSMRTDARAPRWEWLGLDWLSEVVRRIGRA